MQKVPVANNQGTAAVVEPISLVISALMAGAAKGAGESAATAVKDAYASLREMLKQKFVGKPAAEKALEEFSRDPEEWTPTLETYLRRDDVGSDQAILTAAQSLMAVIDPNGSQGGKYTVTLTNAQGVVIGDHTTQTNNFG